jgi:hypothetical protein
MQVILLSVFRPNDILLSVLIIFNEGCLNEGHFAECFSR